MMQTNEVPLSGRATGQTATQSSKSNLELTKDIYANLAKKDIAAVFASLADDAEYIIPGSPDIPYAGVFKGKQEVGRFYKTLFESVQLTSNDLKSMTEDGQKVIAEGAFSGVAKSTGKTFQSDWVIVWTFWEGKVIRHQAFLDSNNIANAIRGERQL